ncbi:hypothetical protein D3C87_1395790 [compost metagenome]
MGHHRQLHNAKQEQSTCSCIQMDIGKGETQGVGHKKEPAFQAPDALLFPLTSQQQW